MRAMAHHPTLIQRPIGRLPGKAVLGRPPERLLELVER
ncbi:MAG TPA: ArsC/Spx/MgsR family protein [Thermoanaerobaculia bacterium]|nr:ArsC/Spx/MgsR family protein [Thermoanaerobaculia bacterium]